MNILTAWRWSVAKWQQLKMMMIENEHFNCNNFNIHSWNYLELSWLLASDVPSHKQVNLTQMLTKCQVDVMYCKSWPPGVSPRLSWGVCLMTGQPYPKAHQMSSWPDPQADQMSSGPNVVPLMLTRFLFLGGPNPMAQVLSLNNKQLLKNQNFRQKFHNFRRPVV